MPPAPINLEPFRAQIELRIAAGQTHAKIREWLATEGIQIGRNAFSQRCVAWEASRYTRTPATDPSLAAAIDTSNRRTVSILRQAVTTIKEYGRCASFFRSD